MRLAPIEQPNTLVLRLAYWMTRRAYGRVITPLKVVYARMPKVLPMSRATATFAQKGLRLDKGLSAMLTAHVGVDQWLRLLRGHCAGALCVRARAGGEDEGAAELCGQPALHGP